MLLPCVVQSLLHQVDTVLDVPVSTASANQTCSCQQHGLTVGCMPSVAAALRVSILHVALCSHCESGKLTVI